MTFTITNYAYSFIL